MIRTTSSVSLFWYRVLRNSVPKIGTSPSSGTACLVACTLLLSSPASTNVWPSPSSTSVVSRRVVKAGTFVPAMDTPLARSMSLTSGVTRTRIRPSPSTMGVARSSTP